jgi:hypothetical protein
MTDGAALADRARRIAALQAARDAIERELELLAGGVTPTVEPKPLSLEQAAHLLGRTRQTAARWATQYGLGVRVGGRWEFDKTRVLLMKERGPTGLNGRW